MRLIISFLAICLCLLSCNKDDDSGSTQYKSGWSDVLITLSAEECENITGDFDSCLCVTKEMAKLYTVSQVLEGLSEEQQEKLNSISTENCGTEFNN